MSAEMDFRAAQVDIRAIAGDSINLTVVVDDIANMPNPVWTAQARDMSGGNAEDFTCTPQEDGVVIVLSAAQTRALSELPEDKHTVTVLGEERTVWRGRYDLQVDHDVNTTRTLIRGFIDIELDVTQ